MVDTINSLQPFSLIPPHTLYQSCVLSSIVVLLTKFRPSLLQVKDNLGPVCLLTRLQVTPNLRQARYLICSVQHVHYTTFSAHARPLLGAKSESTWLLGAGAGAGAGAACFFPTFSFRDELSTPPCGQAHPLCHHPKEGKRVDRDTSLSTGTQRMTEMLEQGSCKGKKTIPLYVFQVELGDVGSRPRPRAVFLDPLEIPCHSFIHGGGGKVKED